MIYTRHITLDLYADRMTEVETQQGDTARALEITVTADGEQLIPAKGTRVNFRGRKPDGYGIDNPATITAQNTIRYQFTEQTVACPGRFPCDIYFVQTDGTLSTVTFWLIVKPHPDGKPGSSSYEYGSLVDATNKALTATGRANDAAKLIEGMTVSASKVAAGGTPTAKLTKQDDHYALALGLVTGDKGDKGDAATVKVGKVTTGDPGSSASVKNSGTSSDATLDFVIPQGPIGPAGGVDSVNGARGDVVIGGTNLLTNSLDPHAIGYDGSTVNKTLNVAVSEWGATDAIRIRGKSGTSNLAAIINSLDGSGQSRPFNRYSEYCISTFIRNDGTSPVTVGRESFTATIQAGESKHVSISCPAPGSLATQIQIQIRTQETDTPYDVVIWHPKIEFGTVATEWSPAPEDYIGPFNIYDVPEMHRNIYRGKYLGDHVTEEQKVAIAAGTWDDLYVGDYWTINGRVYRIADMDYWYNCGDTPFTKHHLVILPDASFGVTNMNDSNTTEGGYTLSKMYTTNLETAKTIIKADFGELVLSHREIFVNAVKNGYPSGYVWTNSDVDLMNEIMVYGCHIYSPMSNGSIIPIKYTIDNSQLALFALNTRMIKTGYTYWLRDVVSPSQFAFVTNYGYSGFHVATGTDGVRPAFAIGDPNSTAGDEPIEGPEMMEDTYGSGAI